MSGSSGLPGNLRSGIESLSGLDMSGVRIHGGGAREALGAHAYAQGADIHLAPGQEQHLPHEAWHVVQQRQGRVQPTLSLIERDNLGYMADSRGGLATNGMAGEGLALGISSAQFG